VKGRPATKLDLAVTFDLDHALVAALSTWFLREARDLPWRKPAPSGRRDPYATLVSELMLQQTQVSRVVDKFTAFMAKFPDPASLARAKESEVLAAWSGLGYYRRAKLLHKAARAIVDDHQGVMPRDQAALLKLPGVGRYTAGAIGSIALGLPMPIVDGNVVRVMLRVHGQELAADDRAMLAWIWNRAAALVQQAAKQNAVPTFNEGLMELGATVCTPKGPDCAACPIAAMCVARRLNKQDRIPKPKTKARKSALWCASVLAIRAGKIAVEERPEKGMWAGLWQAPTLERTDREPTPAEVAKAVGVRAADLAKLGSFKHNTTHRDVTFTVYRTAAKTHGTWKTRAQIQSLGLSNAQRRILLEDWES